MSFGFPADLPLSITRNLGRTELSFRVVGGADEDFGARFLLKLLDLAAALADHNGHHI